jgi:hypothetical protein
MYLLSNGKIGTADDKVKDISVELKYWKKKFQDLDKESKDPSGTICEHSRDIQRQLDNAVRLLGHILDPEKIKELINRK